MDDSPLKILETSALPNPKAEPAALPTQAPQSAEAVRRLPELPFRQWNEAPLTCLNCGAEIALVDPSRRFQCHVCWTEFSVWAMPEITPWPTPLMWVLGFWPMLVPTAMYFAPAVWPGAEVRPALAWTVFGLALLSVYAWAVRRLREQRVPLRHLLALPLAGGATVLNAVFGVALLGLTCVAAGHRDATVLFFGFVGGCGVAGITVLFALLRRVL